MNSPARGWNRGRAGAAAAVALVFVPLACLGILGQGRARRQAQLQDIVDCRESLQEALDARRNEASGPGAKKAAGDTASASRAVMEWAARLARRTTEFRSCHAPVTGEEELELRLGEAVLAIAGGRFSEALVAMGALAPSPPMDAAVIERRRAEIVRAQADARHELGDWSGALAGYEELLALQPDALAAAERAAHCRLALRQGEAALDAHVEVAERLDRRGSRLLAELDHRGAARDLNRSATLRLWLVEQGRRGLTAALARSFAACAAALFEAQTLPLAETYTAHAIDIQSQMVARDKNTGLAGELAESHALRARILTDLGKAGQAADELVSAAAIAARRGDFSRAVEWQKSAVKLAGPLKKAEMQARLAEYTAGRAAARTAGAE